MLLPFAVIAPYIVNVNAIETINGNTNGYKLRIRNTDFQSRFPGPRVRK